MNREKLVDRKFRMSQVHPKTSKSWAADFFGKKKCVVGGTNERARCDWHHLDEDSANNPRDGNLVPLDRGLNQAIDTAGRTNQWDLPLQLSQENVKLAAQIHWASGDFPFSYGVNRLGAFLAISHWNRPSDSLQFAADALHGLRPLWEQSLAIDTLERSILPVLSQRKSSDLSHTSKSAICKEVGSWFLSSRNHQGYLRWMKLGFKFADKSRLSQPEDSFLVEARLAQHKGILLYQAGDFESAREILEMADEAMRDLRYSHGMVNNYQYLARIQLESEAGSLDNAIEQFGRLEEEFGKISPIDEWEFGQERTELWSGLGVMSLKAELEMRQGHVRRARDLYACVNSFLGRKKVQAMEVFHQEKAVTDFQNRYSMPLDSLSVFKRFPKMWPEFSSVAKRVENILNRSLLERA